MKIHLMANGHICQCRHCEPRVALFRKAAAGNGLILDAMDYLTMLDAQIHLRKYPLLHKGVMIDTKLFPARGATLGSRLWVVDEYA